MSGHRPITVSILATPSKFDTSPISSTLFGRPTARVRPPGAAQGDRTQGGLVRSLDAARRRLEARAKARPRPSGRTTTKVCGARDAHRPGQGQAPEAARRDAARRRAEQFDPDSRLISTARPITLGRHRLGILRHRKAAKRRGFDVRIGRRRVVGPSAALRIPPAKTEVPVKKPKANGSKSCNVTVTPSSRSSASSRPRRIRRCGAATDHRAGRGGLSPGHR